MTVRTGKTTTNENQYNFIGTRTSHELYRISGATVINRSDKLLDDLNSLAVSAHIVSLMNLTTHSCKSFHGLLGEDLN